MIYLHLCAFFLTLIIQIIQGEEAVTAIGGAPKAIVLFTHLRRCGGTYLEEAVLKPHIKRINAGRPLLCKEGEMGRFYRLKENKLKSLRAALEHAPLVWRHCPFGIHQLLLNARPYIYITMLRRPRERMLSWFAYCDKYSPDTCKIGRTFQSNSGESRILAFYRIRREKYLASNDKHRPPSEKLSTFHADWLEFALDDNYITRMIAGSYYHDAPVPLKDTALVDAEKNLKEQYVFVGTLERRDKSLCLLSSLLGIPKNHNTRTRKLLNKVPKSYNHRNGNRARTHHESDARATIQKQLTGPTTNSASAQIPADFILSFQEAWRLDDKLYATANTILDNRLNQHPECSGGVA